MHCGHKVLLSERVKQTVIVDTSHNIENWVQIAETALMNNNYQTAEEHANLILGSDISNAVAWMIKGGVGAMTGRWPEAWDAWAKAFLNDKKQNTERMLKIMVKSLGFGLSDQSNKKLSNYIQSAEIANFLRSSDIDGLGSIFDRLFKEIRLWKVSGSAPIKRYFIVAIGLCEYSIWWENNVDEMLYRCNKLTTFHSKIINTINANFKKDVKKEMIEFFESKESCDQLMCSIFVEKLSNLSADKKRNIEEYWNDHAQDREDIANEFIRAYDLHYDAQRRLFKGSAKKEAKNMYTEGLKKFVSAEHM